MRNAMTLGWALVLAAGCQAGCSANPTTRPGPFHAADGLAACDADAGTPPVDAGEPSSDAGATADAGAPDAGPLPAPDHAFRVGAWNIEQFPMTATTSERVAPLIAEHFDLLGVEEITDPAPFHALAAQLPGYRSIVSFESGFIRVGFLYRSDRVEVTNIDRLFTDDDFAFIRAPLKADVRVFDEAGETVFDFVFVVVHLKAQPDAESRMRRAAAMVELEAWLSAELAAGAEQDYVIVGDFNDALLDPRTENVFTPILDRPDLYRFLTLPNEALGEYSYIPFRSMIDHILVTNDALAEYGEGTTEVLALDATIPDYRAIISDHRPVLARFALPAR
ncbi:MAG: endonuclease/exonuclease/phosphatase family protein [Sandaracinaceae bacterium]